MARTKARPFKEQELRALLTNQGLRVTHQRLALLRELARLKTPVSHPELTERLGETNMDRATVYRNLLSLTKEGLLVRTQLGDNVWRFELPRQNTAHERHPHFVCTDCGDIACLPEKAVSLHLGVARRKVTEVQLRGKCESCVG